MVDKVAEAQAKAALASGQFTISTDLAATAVQDLAKAALAASIALRQIQLVKPGGGIGGGISNIFSGGIPAGVPGISLAAQAALDIAAFPAIFDKGGVMGSKGRVKLQKFDSGGIADQPSVALFGGSGRKKEAFVPLPSGDKIPVEIKGDEERGDINVNFFITTPDGDSFRQTQGQLMADALRFVQSGQRNT